MSILLKNLSHKLINWIDTTPNIYVDKIRFEWQFEGSTLIMVCKSYILLSYRQPALWIILPLSGGALYKVWAAPFYD